MIKELDIILADALDNNNDMVKQSIDIDTAKKMLKTDCSQAYEAFKKGVVLLRGHKSKDEIYLAKSGIRVAKNGINVYTLLMSELLDGWKDYPPRNRSIIMSTDIDTASMYAEHNGGKVYNIFPYNGAALAISPTGDFWNAFNQGLLHQLYGKDSLSEFNESIADLISTVIGVSKTKYNSATLRKMYKDVCSAFDKNDVKKVVKYFSQCQQLLNGLDEEKKYVIYDEINGVDKLQKHLIDIASTGKSIMNEINIILDPMNNGIKLRNINNVNIYDFNGYSYDGCEIWTDSPCMFVRYDILDYVA